MRSPERLTELLESTESQVISLIHQRERIIKNADEILSKYGMAMAELISAKKELKELREFRSDKDCY